MGDAILSTPALGAICRHFNGCKVYFLCSSIVREILSPNDFGNSWLEADGLGGAGLICKLAGYKFSRAILMKNSFGAAFTVFCARIKERIGYARDGRSVLLTNKLLPGKNNDGSLKPASMIDYYLNLAKAAGCSVASGSDARKLELSSGSESIETVACRIGVEFSADKPVVIFVPGGAFGASKCWPAEKFAQTADILTKKYKAAIIVSVAPVEEEKQIAEKICRLCENKIYNLAQTSLTIGQLKVLFARADLVISNDTGPRHIAIGLKRNIITLFGPNDPAWTETGYKNEVKIVGIADCVPCAKPKCIMDSHLCMDSITAEAVCESAERFLSKWHSK